MKLLAKTAEERYQSASGIKEDLSVCAREWAARRWVAPFPLGRRDVSDRFLISQKLYGRDREVDEMIEAFDRVCRGSAAIRLVAGYSGIGKTSLIQELYKPIVRQKGYFISGKFDQVVRNVPFGALIQAFRELTRQLLTESDERLALWRDRLSRAAGANGGVLAEVIPEIELILGKQPAPPVLNPTEALNRFQMVFQNFVGALARREHPLVIFLDDLQWADSATLGLLQPLLTSADVRFLFLLGAYRDNEVDASHRLIRTLGALESAGVSLDRITLEPLHIADLTLLIRDTLRCETAEAEPLARLVLEKTDGNPFFVNQFLKMLKREGYLEFDYEKGRWTCSVEAIANTGFTDNVIDLMTRKIQRLSLKIQHTLMLASCIGNQFDLDTLAIVCQQSSQAAETDLMEAIDEEFDESDYAETYRDNPFFTTFQAVAIMHLCYTFEEYEKAMEAARSAREVVYHLSGTILSPRDGRSIPSDQRANDLAHWQTRLIVRDCEAMYKSLRAGKFAFVSSGVIAVPESEMEFTKSFLVRDPDGHVMMLIEK